MRDTGLLCLLMVQTVRHKGLHETEEDTRVCMKQKKTQGVANVTVYSEKERAQQATVLGSTCMSCIMPWKYALS